MLAGARPAVPLEAYAFAPFGAGYAVGGEAVAASRSRTEAEAEALAAPAKRIVAGSRFVEEAVGIAVAEAVGIAVAGVVGCIVVGFGTQRVAAAAAVEFGLPV